MEVRSDSGTASTILAERVEVAALGVETSEVEHDVFRIGIDFLRGFELLFSLLGLVLHGVELAENHTVLNIFGLERNDLLEFGDCLVKHVAAGRRGRNRILGLAKLAQVNAAEELVRAHVVRRGLEQSAGGGFGFAQVARSAEVEVCEGVGELGRARICVQGVLVLLNGVGDVFGLPGVDSLFFVDVGQGGMEVGLGAAGRVADCVGARVSG